MGESTQLHDPTLPRAARREGEGFFRLAWEKIKLVAVRAVFWSYERGSWQYDLILLVILAFIFLTPPSWFNDRPTLQLTDLRHDQGLVEVGRGKDGWHYLVDARLVESLSPQKPEDAIREILHRRLNRPFTIKSWDKVEGKNNVVLGYTVVVTR
jgi:hypothetical protein